MTIALQDVTSLARAISARAAEVLQSDVSVADEWGAVIAASTGRKTPSLTGSDDQFELIRVPLQVARQRCELIVRQAPDRAEALSPRLARALVELVAGEIESTAAESGNRERSSHHLIYRWLTDDQIPAATIEREASQMNIDLSPPRAAIVIDAGDFIIDRGNPRAIVRRADHVIRSAVSFFELPNAAICAWNGEREIVLLKASDTQNLASWAGTAEAPDPPHTSWMNLTALKRAGRALQGRVQASTGATVTIGIGRYHPGARGLAQSYADARAALTLGRRFQRESRVHCLDDLGAAAFIGLADEATKTSLARHLLSPLDLEPDLFRTLEVFLDANCSPSVTSSRLAVHRNTLAYRLDKIATLTGLDPRQFEDAVQARLALLLRSFNP